MEGAFFARSNIRKAGKKKATSTVATKTFRGRNGETLASESRRIGAPEVCAALPGSRYCTKVVGQHLASIPTNQQAPDSS